jgi:hypothetical protein
MGGVRVAHVLAPLAHAPCPPLRGGLGGGQPYIYGGASSGGQGQEGRTQNKK